MNMFEPDNQLKQMRLGRHLSQKQLAEMLGTSRFSIGRWERSVAFPSPMHLAKLCSLFQIQPGELGFPTASVPSSILPAPISAKIEINKAVIIPIAPIHNKPIYDPAIPLPPLIELVGRSAALTQLKQRLFAGGNAALTALNGLPGVGKTALAIALACDQELRAHFADGILWAGLGHNPNIPGLLSRWGTLLGMSSTQLATLTSNEERARAIRSAIGTRTMLLIIDDAWQIEDALTFKVGGPNCAHLVTTRFPTLATHMTADGATILQELNEAESMTLLRQLAPDDVAKELQKSRALIQAVGGLPLALTLIGNYLRSQAQSGQTEHIQAAIERLEHVETRLHIGESSGPYSEYPNPGAELRLSLQSVIAVTDQKLTPQTRSALYALSVFPAKPHSFSEAAALAVADCSLETLDALIDTGLLECSAADRYTLHQTIADYAHLQLVGDQASERFISYIKGFAETHKREYELLEMENNVILAALDAAHATGKRRELVHIVIAFIPFLQLRGLYSQALQHLQHAHEAAISLDDQYGIMNTLLYQGEIALKQGDNLQAQEHLQTGLEIARALDDPERICALLDSIGTVSWKRGEYALGEDYLQEGLNLARQIGDPERICGLLKSLGSAMGSRGNHVLAETYSKEALSFARQIGNREQIGILLMNLGVASSGQGHYDQAEIYLQESLTIASQIGHREQICVILANLGGIQEDKEHYDRAEAYFKEGLTLARTIGHREWICALLINQATTARRQDHYVQAESYIQESLTLAQQIRRPQMSAHALYEYGNLQLIQHKIASATTIFHEMLFTIPEGCQDLKALAEYGLARIAAHHGQLAEAQHLGQISLLALEAIRHRHAREVRNWLAHIENVLQNKEAEHLS